MHAPVLGRAERYFSEQVVWRCSDLMHMVSQKGQGGSAARIAEVVRKSAGGIGDSSRCYLLWRYCHESQLIRVTRSNEVYGRSGIGIPLVKPSRGWDVKFPLR
ncbi:protein of unknown function [Candidatus Filomicrobium marinum]|uniref:Uncharacterized protein n=1 Tax=Candidatus Filomicrobium marinum TaxID=1608628 RepID=A0A0D6JIM4_9HYPH|nr:protein of unknown function [Candidatus Filomicrobium marinum]CPR21791.1 protein of unknown function [Candidatus Filomicrobium marinum]